MSARQAKRALDAANAFYEASMSGDDFLIARMARILSGRFLGDKHFEQLQQYFHDLHTATKIKISGDYAYNPQAPLARRRLEIKSLHMGFGLTAAGDVAARKYIPLSLESNIAYNHLDYRLRPLPVQFISSHTEERFEFWQRRETDYSSDDFKRAVSLSLALTFPLEKIMIERKQRSMPVSIPYAGGLFLGHISLYPAKENLFHQPAIYAHRDVGENRLIASDGLNGNSMPPYWQPVSVITLVTHVSKLWPEQKALVGQMENILGTYKGQRGLDAAIPVYTAVRPPQSGHHLSFLHDLQNELNSLARSAVWEKANEGGWKHTPRREFGPQ